MEPTNISQFSIKSRAEAELFVLRHREALARYGGGVAHISLAKVFTKCDELENGGKIFASIFDIYINASLIWIDAYELGGALNERIRAHQPGAFVLDNVDVFATCLNEHRYATSFVFRYRALWDKLMGLLILIAEPEKYERYASAKSRKAEFKKICASSMVLPSELATHISDVLEEFDNDFRTPEAHGTGRLRKFTFTVSDPIHRPSAELMMKYWTYLNGFLHQLDRVLIGLPSARD